MHEPGSSRASEVERRLAEIRSLLEQADADGIVLGLRCNFAWLTAGGLNHVVVASEDGAAPILVTHDSLIGARTMAAGGEDRDRGSGRPTD